MFPSLEFGFQSRKHVVLKCYVAHILLDAYDGNKQAFLMMQTFKRAEPKSPPYVRCLQLFSGLVGMLLYIPAACCSRKSTPPCLACRGPTI